MGAGGGACTDDIDDFIDEEDDEEVEDVWKSRTSRKPRAGGKRGKKDRTWSTFWGAHQKFFHQLCCAAKVRVGLFVE